MRKRAHRPGAGEKATSDNRRGIVLVIVLIVVAILSLAAYAFTDVMLAENEVTHIAGRRVQAYSLASSGIASVRSFLMQDELTRTDAGGTYNNPAQFQALAVASDEATDIGRFTIVAPALDTEGSVAGTRYGLEDESARVNLNVLLKLEEVLTAAGMGDMAGAEDSDAMAGLEDMASEAGFGSQISSVRDMLMTLPGMTYEIADAILDWMDEDDEPREYGAEVDYYSAIDPPYATKNGLLETVEELLLVRGVTPQLLFGADVNRNGLIDENEMAQAAAFGDASSLSRGWASMMTLHSKEHNNSSLGEPRVNLNMDDMQQLYDSLSLVFPADWVTFIIAYRQNDPYMGDEAGEAYSSGDLDLQQAGKTKLVQVLELVGAKVEVTFQGEEEATVLQSPFGEDLSSMMTYMTTLMDFATVVDAPTIPGRININQASREVLAGIPGMTDELLEQIISLRTPEPEMDNPDHVHETWLLTEGLVTPEEMRTLLPFVCAGGDVYRTQVVGFYDNGQASARLEVLLDATQTPPRVLLWRDISHLGRGFPLEILGAGMGDIQ